MQNSNRPRRILQPFGALAGSGFINTIPNAAASGGAASYEQGFPPETFQPVASGGTPPSGKDVNGVLFDATGNARWLAAGGPAMFDATFANAVGGYPMYAVLASTTVGKFWQSTVDNNTGDPDAGAANWAAIISPAGTTTGNFERRPSGILEQWGTTTFSSTAQPVVGVSLYQPYVDGTYVVSLTPIITNPSTERDTWVQLISASRTTSSFQVQYQNSDDRRAGLEGFTWRAIGR